jgi:hypothetical protein
MYRSGSVSRIFRIIALMGGLLALAWSQAWSANKKVFTETWQQKFVCAKIPGSSFKTCDEVSSGKFSIKTTFSAGLDPSVLSPSSSEQFDIFLGGYSFGPVEISTANSFTSGKKGSSATFQLTTQKCSSSGGGCDPNFQFEKIVLTVTKKKGDLTVAITAVTGSDFNGDSFESSIEAADFVGGNHKIQDSISLQVDLGSFTFNDADNANVIVKGSVKTKFRPPPKGSSSVVRDDIDSNDVSAKDSNDDAATDDNDDEATPDSSDDLSATDKAKTVPPKPARGPGSGSSSNNIKSSTVKITGSLQR